MNTQNNRRDDAATLLLFAGAGVAALALVVAMIIGSVWGFKAFNRTQRVAEAKNVVTTSRIDANNKVKLNEIKISQQAQRVKIAEQEAEVRLREARGVKAAQDEIAKTLTPEYIQYEMTKVLADIAKSGKNSSVIYIPVGPDGLPVIANSDARANTRR
ncbi:hypothetical protein [Streptomyces sp. NRRL B-1347]|uniref:hypothetical protein n=1 Tax=Streptomyces sp. NRRL B-1347 TaxID=1476877 RepID=UPI0006899D2B|nr:hypothetical protein [Streptomyces sp. NRRL B-1347]